MGAATKGALWTLASALSFMAANILIKHLSTKLPALEMALFRSAGGLFLAFVAWRAFLHLRQIKDPAWHLTRAAVGAVSLMALVHAYSSLPIALVTGVMYVRVLLVIPMQRVVLGERADRRVWVAAGIGIAGALVALWHKLMAVGTPHWDWAVGSLAVAALAGAGSQICMRRLARTNPAALVVGISAILISVIVALPASYLNDFVLPIADRDWLSKASDWIGAPWVSDKTLLIGLGMVVGMALLSACAQWATVQAYKHAPPAVLMPVTLVDVPIGVVADYFLWGQTVTANGIVGASIIIGAALYVTRSSRAESR